MESSPPRPPEKALDSHGGETILGTELAMLINHWAGLDAHDRGRMNDWSPSVSERATVMQDHSAEASWPQLSNWNCEHQIPHSISIQHGTLLLSGGSVLPTSPSPGIRKSEHKRLADDLRKGGGRFLSLQQFDYQRSSGHV